MSVAYPHQPSQVVERHRTIPDGFSNELVRTLATLQGAEPRAAQALIASLPYGSRATLSTYGMIKPIDRSPGAISQITITSAGWNVIRACSDAYAPTESEEAQWAADLRDAEVAYRAGRFALVDSLEASLRRAGKRIERWRGRSASLK